MDERRQIFQVSSGLSRECYRSVWFKSAIEPNDSSETFSGRSPFSANMPLKGEAGSGDSA